MSGARFPRRRSALVGPALQVHRIVSAPSRQNCYVVAHAGGDAVVIDPGCEPEPIREHVAASRLRVRAVLATHAHHDHVARVAAVVAQHGAPFHLHPGDERLLLRANFYRALVLGGDPIDIPTVDRHLADGATLRFGELSIGVLHTPGHTPGGVCFAAAGELFTGDTVMAGRVGRTDLPGGDRATLERSVALLAADYPPETTIRPGHGEPALLGEVAARLPELLELRE